MTERQFLEKFLRESAAYVREKYAARDSVAVTSKSNASDFLTEVDLTVQKRAADALHKHFPGDLLVAEEGDQSVYPEDHKARCWVLDPVDGTANFVRGMYPAFGISLAFYEQGLVQLGGVALPVTQQVFFAQRGGGAFRNNHRIAVSRVQSLAEARIELEYGLVYDREAVQNESQRLVRHAGQIRIHGSAVVSICQVACGELDAALYLNSVKAWDHAAAGLILEEAGGVCSRPDGKPLHIFGSTRGAIFSNGAIHAEIVDLLD